MGAEDDEIPGITDIRVEHILPGPPRETFNNPQSFAYWRRTVLPSRAWHLERVEQSKRHCEWCGEEAIGLIAYMRHPHVKADLRVCRSCCMLMAGSDGTPGAEPQQHPDVRTECLERERYANIRHAERTRRRVEMLNAEDWVEIERASFAYQPPGWKPHHGETRVWRDEKAGTSGAWRWMWKVDDIAKGEGGPVATREDAIAAIARHTVEWFDG